MVLCGVLCMETHAQDSHWQYDAYAYRYDMTAFVSLSINGNMVTDYSDYEIAAFCGEECRGIASVQKVERDGAENTYGYLRIRSNQNAGETITFKVFQKSSAQEMNVNNTSVEFQSQQVVGLPSTPMLLSVVHFTVSISCDEAMGTVSGGGSHVAGDMVTLSATPVEGYHFVKWSDEATDNPYTFTVSADVSLTATFAPNQYTITFDSNGGTTVEDLTADYKSAITAPEAPTRAGYTFAGWEPAFPETMPLNGAALTAQWTPIVYTLAYDLAGGSAAAGLPSSYTIESEAITLNNPTREGYTFAGWIGTGLTEATQVVTIAAGSTGNRAYTAIWTINQYTITFDTDGGSEVAAITQDYATEVTAPADPTKTGYTFTGWEPAVPETIPAEDMTVTAQWQINQYTITFDTDGGSEVAAITQDYNTVVTAPADPTKTGFTFKGWEPAIPATIPAEDVTITAQWERNSYKLTFIVDGVENTTDVLYEAEVTKPADPEKEGYTFTGWDKDIPATMPAEDVTVTATWTVIQYSISYDLAGGHLPEGMTNPVSYTIESEAITLANPTREGYKFEGWTGTGLSEPTLKVTIATGSTGHRSYTATWVVITAITALSSDNKNVSVYDLNGRMLRSNIPVSTLNKELPSGIYIIDGKKVRITRK